MNPTSTEISDAVNAFKDFKVAHRKQTEALEQVLFQLRLSPNAALVVLVGPTGIGKTALQQLIMEALVEEHREEMERDPTFCPAISTSAMASGWRLYDWKTLYEDAFQALRDPFLKLRNALWTKCDKEELDSRRLTGESRTAARLRLRLEEEFRRRRTRYWLIDEAAHILFGGKGGSPGDQFDVLKSICERTGVKLLLSGPREIEDQVSHSSQLARRRSTVRYRRYLPSREDIATFASVAQTLFAHMKISGHPAVSENLTFLYVGSAGCVGILKDWLARGYGRALSNSTGGRCTLTLDDLRATRLPVDDMKTVMRDIQALEEPRGQDGRDTQYEQIVLQRKSPDADNPDLPERKRKAKRVTRRRPIGTRRPGRDPVGDSTDNQGGQP